MGAMGATRPPNAEGHVMVDNARRWVSASCAALLIVALGAAIPAAAAVGDGVCNNNEFCGYRHANYGSLVFESMAPRGSTGVTAPANIISSVNNRTNDRWIGWNERGGILPDQNVLSVAPKTSIATPSSVWNDKIEYFNVRTP